MVHFLAFIGFLHFLPVLTFILMVTLFSAFAVDAVALVSRRAVTEAGSSVDRVGLRRSFSVRCYKQNKKGKYTHGNQLKSISKQSVGRLPQ